MNAIQGSTMRRHLIATACDARCGDFLLDHWHVSLRANVVLDHIDILVLDYGLTESQRRRVMERGMLLQPAVKDGHVTNVRYRDLAGFLAEHAYDQVLLVDSGDVIFQKDISHLFGTNQRFMRAVYDERKFAVQDVLPILADFQPGERARVAALLRDRPQINGGFVLGPASGFTALWHRFERMTRSMQTFASDQVLINYVLHQDGFQELPSTYNFVLVAAVSRFTVRQGRFYGRDGGLLSVVHNAGCHAFFRRVASFSYGPQYNRPKLLSCVAVRLLFMAAGVYGSLTRTLAQSLVRDRAGPRVTVEMPRS